MRMSNRLRPLRKNLWVIVASTALALVVTAGTLYSTGVYDRWREDRSVDSACDGTLAEGNLSKALGSDRFEAGNESAEGALAHCKVSATDDGDADRGLTVDLRWQDQVAARLNVPFLPMRDDLLVGDDSKFLVPLGQGWHATTTIDDGYRMVLSLSCRNKPGRALVATGELMRNSSEVYRSAPLRIAFARTVAETAEAAAGEYGCDARPGHTITRAPAMPWGAPPKMEQATGTCRALRPLATRAARLDIHEAVGAPTSATADAEECLLLTKESENNTAAHYLMTAVYGFQARIARESGPADPPFGAGRSSQRDDDSGVWASASCPGSPERAYYTLSGLPAVPDGDGGEERRAFERKALSAFAERSAKIHGCSDLQLPE